MCKVYKQFDADPPRSAMQSRREGIKKEGLTIDVDLDGGGHGAAIGGGLVLGGAPELAEEVVAAELEADLVAAGAGAVRLLERARLACARVLIVQSGLRRRNSGGICSLYSSFGPC